LIIAFAKAQISQDNLPLLVMPGFAWAENLVFDGLGNLFVSEAVRGELWRINLNANGSAYDGSVYLDRGFKQFGGLVVSPDGERIYAGVTFDDKSYGIIVAPTTSKIGTSTVLARTKHQPNGLSADWAHNTLFYTDEGTGSEEGGTLVAVDVATGQESLIKDNLPLPDGLWFDSLTNKLYVGELFTKKINVFNIASDGAVVFEAVYTGLNEALNFANIIDDITLFSNCADGNTNTPSCTMLLAADWTGRSLQKFALDGSSVTKVAPPAGVDFKELTSVRWGSGPGFDSESVYVTEGGGIVGKETNRRVIQVKMK